MKHLYGNFQQRIALCFSKIISGKKYTCSSPSISSLIQSSYKEFIHILICNQISVSFIYIRAIITHSILFCKNLSFTNGNSPYFFVILPYQSIFFNLKILYFIESPSSLYTLILERNFSSSPNTICVSSCLFSCSQRSNSCMF